MKMIYLDNAATTQLDFRVYEAMEPFLRGRYGNPGSLYKLGRDAAKAVDKAREQVAAMLHCTPEHIIFTSGGSESNSMVFAGLIDYLNMNERMHVAVSSIEHDSVLKAAGALIKRGFYTSFIAPKSDGIVQLSAVQDTIHLNIDRFSTGVVSVMYANNEIGSVNDISVIGAFCRDHDILFHSDCVQATGQYELDVDKLNVDFVSISSHKLHGPKGVGALYVRNLDVLSPVIQGGRVQEFGLRGGTENVPGIVGMGKACEIVSIERDKMNQVFALKRFFVGELLEAFNCVSLGEAGISVNGSSLDSDSKVLNLKIEGVNGESLVLMMDAVGVCISAGSACSSHNSKPSHVLKAIGLSEDEARSCVRVSFSRMNSIEEVADAAMKMSSCIKAIRSWRS